MQLPIAPRLYRDDGRSARVAFLLALLVLCGLLTVPASAAAAPACGVLAPGAAPEAARAVANTCEQVGTPYSWGGGHGPTPGPTYGLCDPANGAPNDCHVIGFDCSGLVRYGYYLGVGADILDKGNTSSQYNSPAVKQRLTDPSQFLPGDLLYYSKNGAPSGIHHVAMYLGGGYIVEAANSGTLVGVASLSSHNDFLGATRLYLPLADDGGSVNHRLRRADGTWTVFGDLGMPSATRVAAAADPSGNTHALAITGGQISHRIRNTDGTWTAWGLVANPGTATAVTAATDSGGNLQLAAVIDGQVQHRIRNANGIWTPWGAVGAAGGTFTAVAGAIDNTATVFHLTAVFNGQIYHRIRNTDGTWTPWALAGNPGTAIALGATIDPDRNLHLITAY